MTNPNAQSSSASVPRVLVIGTGGTIAGTAASASDNVGYTAAQIGVAELVASIPSLSDVALETRQVAQVDSKDMTHAIWRSLAHAVQEALDRCDIAGVVITHGTDTLEETAYLLHRVLRTPKAVVLTAAMRPATSLNADGPQNVADAVRLASLPQARGVLVALNGAVWAGSEVRKTHTYRLDAFSAGDAGPLAWIEEGQVRWLREPAPGTALGVAVLDTEVWPDVQIVVSHAGADGRLVDLLAESGAQGIVIAATGNGTIHREIEAAVLRARARGVETLRATRVGSGMVIEGAEVQLPSAGALTAPQARVELLLRLLGRRA